jgi:prepilin-type N-terminal cleavage/methylation domain-containing protein
MHCCRRATSRCGHRAVTLVEVLLVVALLAVLAAVLWPLVMHSRRAGDPVRDATDLAALHAAFVQHSRSHGGELPRPSQYGSEVGAGGDRPVDTTASLFSLVLAERSVTAGMLISRGELNPVVEECRYDFSQINAAEGRHWDPGFRTDLDRRPGDGVCNTSYAHLALCGERLARWRADADAVTPLLGDRGTYRGSRSGNRWRKSYTLGRHGQPAQSWGGNMVFGDGHTSFITSFFPLDLMWECGSIKPTKDNIFDCEYSQTDCTNGLRDGRAAGDVWLCLTRKAAASTTSPGLLLDIPERLIDGSPAIGTPLSTDGASSR